MPGRSIVRLFLWSLVIATVAKGTLLGWQSLAPSRPVLRLLVADKLSLNIADWILSGLQEGMAPSQFDVLVFNGVLAVAFGLQVACLAAGIRLIVNLLRGTDSRQIRPLQSN